MNNGICIELHRIIGNRLYQKYADMYPSIGEFTAVCHVNYPVANWRHMHNGVKYLLSFMLLGSDRGEWNEEAKRVDFIDDTRFALCYVGQIDTIFINDYYTYRWAEQK